MKRCKMPCSPYSLETVVLATFSFLCAKYCPWEKFSSLPSAAAIQFTPRSINPDSLLRYPGSYSGIRILLPVSGGSSPVSGSHSGIRFFCGIRVFIMASGFSSWYPGVLLPVSGFFSRCSGSSSGFCGLLPVSEFLFWHPDSPPGILGFFFRYLGGLLPVSGFSF